jgi:hypothetical protein
MPRLVASRILNRARRAARRRRPRATAVPAFAVVI